MRYDDLIERLHPDDITSFEVYFGEENPPTVLLQTTDQSTMEVNATVTSGTTYFWRVNTTDSSGNTSDSGIYDFKVNTLPKTQFPDPIHSPRDLASIGRMNASSMFIKTEKLPGFEAFKANDDSEETRWLANNSKQQYLEVEWLKPQTFSKVVIDEYRQNISKYTIECFQNNEWVILINSSKCGANKEHVFNAVTSNKCRIFIEAADKAPSIKEIKILK